MILATLTFEVADLSGTAMGPAIATAANSMVVRVVSCMVDVCGLVEGLGVESSFGEFLECRAELGCQN